MVLNDLADSFCHSQKNARLKGLTRHLFTHEANISVDAFLEILALKWFPVAVAELSCKRHSSSSATISFAR